jgi:hypothetical protein
MEITLAYYKGANREPNAYRTTFLFYKEKLLMLCPTNYILALAIKDNVIEVDGFTYAKPFFTSNLQDLTKAILVY